MSPTRPVQMPWCSFVSVAKAVRLVPFVFARVKVLPFTTTEALKPGLSHFRTALVLPLEDVQVSSTASRSDESLRTRRGRLGRGGRGDGGSRGRRSCRGHGLGGLRLRRRRCLRRRLGGLRRGCARADLGGRREGHRRLDAEFRGVDSGLVARARHVGGAAQRRHHERHDVRGVSPSRRFRVGQDHRGRVRDRRLYAAGHHTEEHDAGAREERCAEHEGAAGTTRRVGRLLARHVLARPHVTSPCRGGHHSAQQGPMRHRKESSHLDDEISHPRGAVATARDDPSAVGRRLAAPEEGLQLVRQGGRDALGHVR